MQRLRLAPVRCRLLCSFLPCLLEEHCIADTVLSLGLCRGEEGRIKLVQSKHRRVVLTGEGAQVLMKDKDSPIRDFYPLDFRVDCEGKRAEWEGVVLVRARHSRVYYLLDGFRVKIRANAPRGGRGARPSTA